MGMDVIGKNPTDEVGDYFRNNLWYWRPLWEYCCEIGADLIDEQTADDCHCNCGAGLDNDDAVELGLRLLTEVQNGNCAVYERKYHEYIASLPKTTCSYCEGTGIRTDEVGLEMSMPTRKLDDEVAFMTGRTHGYCNACQGWGEVLPFEANYPFSVANVIEFSNFLRTCGGFEVW
jgi:hypothetical protein